MGKEKFVYNTQTLRYEKVVEPLRVKLLRAFMIACGVLVFSTFVAVLSARFLDSPEEQALRAELSMMEKQYNELNERINLSAKVLEDIQERDRNVHRVMFGMDPIDQGVWKGGVGGHERLTKFNKYKNSGKLMAAISAEMERLERQLVLQSKSLDTIFALTKDRETMLASIPSIKPVREDKLNRSISLLSGFGMRLHPIHKVMKMHAGIDFSSPIGTKIYATGDGRIVKLEHSKSGYGLHIVIDHGYGYKTLYGHMSKTEVSLGQKVNKGQLIGLVGNTGTSTAPHLHYEVHYKDQPVNPIHFVMDGLTTEEYKQLVEMAATTNQSFDYH